MSDAENQFAADRNLLFGILALQVNFIGRGELLAALNRWVIEKTKPLSQILLERHAINEKQASLVGMLVEQHLALNGQDAEQSLRATGTRRREFSHIADSNLQASILNLRDDPEVPDTVAPLSGEEVRYRKLRHHRDGGQGRVYVAKDTELHRDVALKEIKPERANDDTRLRLILEAEITGGLEHPGIVPVYGLGTYSNGQPFYAMRFIRGESLDTAIGRFHLAEKAGRDAGERSLEFRQLLRRFVDVCNAVAYAHSRGVVHRDLKPNNIMLGKFGETLVVDWGLAKFGAKDDEKAPLSAITELEATLRPVSGSSVEVTEDGQQIGTPPFMSPEQADGRTHELGPASDIYSLGSTLYALLTGTMPFTGRTKDEILEKVKTGLFTAPNQLKLDTPAALNAICCKAMSLQAEDRYPSAQAIAEEIEHWLADEPVNAYPEPFPIRVGRWARRHRVSVASFGVSLLCAVFGLSMTTFLVSMEKRQTDHQKDLANKNYSIAKKQSFNLISLIESSEPEFARVPLLHDRRAELLKAASDACRRFMEQNPDDITLMRRSANIFRFSANFNRLTYKLADATPLYHDSIALRKRLLEEFASGEDQFQLCEVLRDFASSRKDEGHLLEADQHLNDALVIADGLLKQSPNRLANRRSVALLLVNRAFLARRLGPSKQSDDPAKLLLRALDLMQSLEQGPLLERHPYDPLLMATVLNQRAIVERETGDLASAQTSHYEAIKLLASLLEVKPKDVNESDVVHFRAECQLEQCETWAKVADPKYLTSAEANAGLAINKTIELVQDYPSLPTYREALANAFRIRGEILLQKKNFQGAREHLTSAKQVLESLLPTCSGVPRLHGDLGKTLIGLAHVARQLQDEDRKNLLDQAAIELHAAAQDSPDDIVWRRYLDELNQLQSLEVVN